MSALDKKEIRMSFSKTGRAVYISHLDLMRTMQRAIKRSGIPVWYSEGFNPRLYLNFPLALSLGTVGKCEPMDLYITEDISFDELRDRLNDALPDGIQIIKVYEPVNTNKDICGAEYFLRMSGVNITSLLEEFFGSDTIMIQKHSKKKGMISLDIKQFCKVRDIVSSGENSADFCMKLPAGNDMNINAGAVTDSIIAFCTERGVSAEVDYTERTKIFCEDDKEFV